MLNDYSGLGLQKHKQKPQSNSNYILITRLYGSKPELSNLCTEEKLMAAEEIKILLIEDEKKIADTLKKGLQENGYTVDLAYDGNLGYHM
ncbi:MAG TPA: hypothetical protein VET23_11065, partial [Chitinophagaceae bacterium]|nr:hypothetical protein [Chitinophagaceae bacterium]